MPAVNSTNTTIEKFRQVDKNLYRGACPTLFQFKELKDRGFDSVISLRSGFDKSGQFEKELVENLGMKYYNFPIDSRTAPSNKIVTDFFRLTDELRSKNEKIFLHCKHGRDRTGMFVALYEIKNRIKDFSGAVREFFAMGYNYEKHPGMLEFVKKFAKNIK